MMKNVLFTGAVMLLLGAGCAKMGEQKPEEVRGDWFLAFNLPEGWVMVDQYDPESRMPLDRQITKDQSEVVIQSVDKKIVPEGTTTKAQDIVQKDYLKVSMTKLDARRAFPEGLTDMGNNFYSSADGKYYMKTDSGTYVFTVINNGKDKKEAEAVIKTAKVVNVE